MSMLSNLELIRRVPLFALLTCAQAEAVADAVVKRRFKRGEAVVDQGSKSNTLFILLTGRARVVTADRRGREVILATLQPGDYLGEMSLIDNQAHSASVRAEVQTDMLALGRAEFARCLPENNSMAYAIMKGLVQRLRQADRKIESRSRGPSGRARPHFPPGHCQNGGCVPRNGQPGDEGPGGARFR